MQHCRVVFDWCVLFLFQCKLCNIMGWLKISLSLTVLNWFLFNQHIFLFLYSAVLQILRICGHFVQWKSCTCCTGNESFNCFRDNREAQAKKFYWKQWKWTLWYSVAVVLATLARHVLGPYTSSESPISPISRSQSVWHVMVVEVDKYDDSHNVTFVLMNNVTTETKKECSPPERCIGSVHEPCRRILFWSIT
jgi:hypothetical protein